MSWCAYEICSNPAVEEKLVVELQKAYEYKQPSYDAATLPYLQAFIYETLRLHPSVPMEGKVNNHSHVHEYSCNSRYVYIYASMHIITMTIAGGVVLLGFAREVIKSHDVMPPYCVL